MLRDCDDKQAALIKHDEYYALVVYVAQSRKLSLNVQWVIDSGCTQHSCNERNAFTSVAITLADGSYTSGRGDVGEFKDVNYTPDFKHNLLSVHQLTMQGYTITFPLDDSGIIQSNEGCQKIGVFNQGEYTTTLMNPIIALPGIVRDQTMRHMKAPTTASNLVH
jgi:hypothetical protein